MPFNLRVTRPTPHNAKKKLIAAAKRRTIGKGKILLNIAVMYTPIPKKAADPSDIYLVVPLKKCQLTANPIQHITLVSNVK
jgi:hypothetical protein